MMRWWKISGWLNRVRVATPTRERQQVKNRESGQPDKFATARSSSASISSIVSASVFIFCGKNNPEFWSQTKGRIHVGIHGLWRRYRIWKTGTISYGARRASLRSGRPRNWSLKQVERASAGSSIGSSSRTSIGESHRLRLDRISHPPALSGKIKYSLYPFAPENSASRDRFGRPIRGGCISLNQFFCASFLFRFSLRASLWVEKHLNVTLLLCASCLEYVYVWSMCVCVCVCIY